jgi:hypothetical protein
LDDPKTAITEGIRQFCIIKRGMRDNKYSEVGLYFQDVLEDCIKSKETDIQACSKDVRLYYNEFLMNEDDLERCLQRNLEVRENEEGENEIPFLKTQIEMGDFFNYEKIPSVFVNEHLVRGAVEGDLAAGAICDSMNNPPESCKWVHLQALKSIHDRLDLTMEKREERFINGIIFVVVLCILAFMFSLCFFKKLAKQSIDSDLQERARSTVAMYHKVNDTDSHVPANVSPHENEMSTLPQP